MKCITRIVLVASVIAFSGCATLKNSASSCVGTLAQETQLLTAAAQADELAALALIDALPFGECVIKQLADKFIASHQQLLPPVGDAGTVTADLAQSNSVDAIRLRNLMDWRAENP